MTKSRINADNVGRTLINTTSLTGLSTLSISIPSGYRDLIIDTYGIYTATDADYTYMRFNNDSTSTYRSGVLGAAAAMGATTQIQVCRGSNNSTHALSQKAVIEIQDYTSTLLNKLGTNLSAVYATSGATNPTQFSQLLNYNGSAAITTINLYTNSAGNWSGGTVSVYGIK